MNTLQQLESKVVKDYNILLSGSISSGKSLLLSNLFFGLRYNNVHASISKERFTGPGGALYYTHREREKKLMHRNNATDKADIARIYGLSGKNVFAFNLIAPGAHYTAEKVDMNYDGAVHILDTNLAKFLDDKLFLDFCIRDSEGLKYLVSEYVSKLYSGNILTSSIHESVLDFDNYLRELSKGYRSEDIMFHGFENFLKENEQKEGGIIRTPFFVKDSGNFFRASRTPHVPNYAVYSQERTNLVLESILASDFEIERMIGDVPVQCMLRQALRSVYGGVGYVTNNLFAGDLLEKYTDERGWAITEPERLFSLTKSSFRRALGLYNEFLIETENGAVPTDILGFEDKYIGKHIIDSTIKDKKPLIRMMHELMAEVVFNSGYEKDDFRLVSFGKMNNDAVINHRSIDIR